tara:strand:+ start:180 stop:374 length:195 start_codon:yes stop_codon:yes gene_type:complete
MLILVIAYQKSDYEPILLLVDAILHYSVISAVIGQAYTANIGIQSVNRLPDVFRVAFGEIRSPA